jgi:hypothetical protein
LEVHCDVREHIGSVGEHEGSAGASQVRQDSSLDSVGVSSRSTQVGVDTGIPEMDGLELVKGDVDERVVLE